MVSAHVDVCRNDRNSETRSWQSAQNMHQQIIENPWQKHPQMISIYISSSGLHFSLLGTYFYLLGIYFWTLFTILISNWLQICPRWLLLVSLGPLLAPSGSLFLHPCHSCSRFFGAFLYFSKHIRKTHFLHMFTISHEFWCLRPSRNPQKKQRFS